MDDAEGGLVTVDHAVEVIRPLSGAKDSSWPNLIYQWMGPKDPNDWEPTASDRRRRQARLVDVLYKVGRRLPTNVPRITRDSLNLFASSFKPRAPRAATSPLDEPQAVDRAALRNPAVYLLHVELQRQLALNRATALAVRQERDRRIAERRKLRHDLVDTEADRDLHESSSVELTAELTITQSMLDTYALVVALASDASDPGDAGPMPSA